MNRKLWSVFVGHDPVAIVAADRPDDAWRIVSALEEFDDLPDARAGSLGLSPCPPERAFHTMGMVRSLGVEGSFIACLGSGMFLSEIGALSAEELVSRT